MTTALDACSDLPVVHFAPGDVLLREGDRGTRLLVLIEGEVSVTRDGNEVARIATPAAVFGEMSALLDIPYSASVTAVTDLRAHLSEDAAGFIHSHPVMAIHTARVLAQRLYHATTYLADMKRQFADKSDHFGMVDEILDELMQQQRQPAAAPAERSGDPRL